MSKTVYISETDLNMLIEALHRCCDYYGKDVVARARAGEGSGAAAVQGRRKLVRCGELAQQLDGLRDEIRPVVRVKSDEGAAS